MIRQGDEFVVFSRYGDEPLLREHKTHIATDVSGPCNCPEYVALINGHPEPTPDHWHVLAGKSIFNQIMELDNGELWNVTKSCKYEIVRRYAVDDLFGGNYEPV